MEFSDKHIHLISFDVPYPANYGGVIDVYYKLVALRSLGVNIDLHCYEYGRGPSDLLESVCSSVTYYTRKISKAKLFNSVPYIVSTRNSSVLLSNLLNDNHPILMEGMHSCFHLGNDQLRNRNIIVRMHNIEHHYYLGLARVENNLFKRYYYHNEASKLEKFEPVLNNATAIASISVNDTLYYKSKFNNVFTLPPFHPYSQVTSIPGKGTYALYHGNLAIGENREAAFFLIEKVFSQLPDLRLVIAGSKPGKDLIQKIENHKNIELRSDINPEELQGLIQHAHLNVLTTFQPTGVKLKLLSALFLGRHLVVNNAMVEGTGLQDLCHLADDSGTMVQKISSLFSKPFESDEILKRENLLQENYNNDKNAIRLIERLR